MAEPERPEQGDQGPSARAESRTGPGGSIDSGADESDFERFKAQTRLHIVEELLRAHELGWELIEAVSGSEDRVAARAVLMGAPYEFDAIAAEHVLDVQLVGRTKAAIENRKDERDRLMAFLS